MTLAPITREGAGVLAILSGRHSTLGERRTMEILVVDDDPYLRKLTCFILTDAGYVTRQADERVSVLQALNEREPELILLDVAMPNVSGFDLCREIRSRSDVPIIFVSARGQLEDRVTGLQIGGDDYVVKPFEPVELLARIGAVRQEGRQVGAERAARDLQRRGGQREQPQRDHEGATR